MQKLMENLRDLGFIKADEMDYIEGVLRSEPFPKTAKELGNIIREARKHGKKQKET